jgi:hypothetical protein
MHLIVAEKSISMEKVRLWTASNGRYLDVVAGVIESISDEGIKAWSQPVLTVFPSRNFALDS